MALAFGEHQDVLFVKAPLESVVCQVRYSPVLALLDQAGVAGFQEALRSRYPDLGQEAQATVALTPQGGSVQTSAPNRRLTSSDGFWRVSIAADFVALETTEAHGYSFQGFWDRFAEVLLTLDRTVRVVSSRRIGFRKVNIFSHPDVTSVKDWSGWLRSELLGLSVVPEMPDQLTSEYAEVHFPDEQGGTLSVRHGAVADNQAKYRLDLDYWTDRRDSPRQSRTYSSSALRICRIHDFVLPLVTETRDVPIP